MAQMTVSGRYVSIAWPAHVSEDSIPYESCLVDTSYNGLQDAGRYSKNRGADTDFASVGKPEDDE